MTRRSQYARTVLRLVSGLLAGLLLAAAAAGAGAKPLTVVTTVPDLAWIVREIGGDCVSVTSLCKGYQDPHYLEAKPSYARDLREADLLVYVGLELEVGWLPRLLDTARNTSLRPGSPGLLEASKAVDTLLDVPTGTVSRAEGDVHPFGNPHFLLDPRVMLPLSDLVADRLATLDPEGSAAYAERHARFKKTMEERLAAWEATAAPLRGATLVAYHKQWEYLTNWLGISILDYVENRPGVPSSPRHVSDLIQNMKQNNVTVVIAAPFVDIHAAQEVARRAKGTLIELPAAVGGADGADTYPDLIQTILDALLAARS